MTSIAGIHTARMHTDTHLTPRELFDYLPAFDLDPCAAPEPRPWPTACEHICLPADGLNAEWHGLVWLNPPYGKQTAKWLDRAARYRNCIALTFARTDTRMFHEYVFTRATAIFFIRSRLTFCRADGTPHAANSGGPSVLIAYNDACAAHLEEARHRGLDGFMVWPSND